MGLRGALHKHWKLPPELSFRHTGKDWLLILLNNTTEEARAKLLLMFWRAWHLRNNIVHEAGDETIDSSVSFLLSYGSAGVVEGCTKGKDTSCQTPMQTSAHVEAPRQPLCISNGWIAPSQGWVKLNSDASFLSACRASGAGSVARDHNRHVLFAACSPTPGCTDAGDAEAAAALKSVELASSLGYDKVILELDNATLVSALRSTDLDRSRSWVTIDRTKACLRNLADFRVIHSKRDNNRVADALAKLARSAGSCLWRCSALLPDHVSFLVADDLNPCIPVLS